MRKPCWRTPEKARCGDLFVFEVEAKEVEGDAADAPVQDDAGLLRVSEEGDWAVGCVEQS